MFSWESDSFPICGWPAALSAAHSELHHILLQKPHIGAILHAENIHTRAFQHAEYSGEIRSAAHITVCPPEVKTM